MATTRTVHTPEGSYEVQDLTPAERNEELRLRDKAEEDEIEDLWMAHLATMEGAD